MPGLNVGKRAGAGGERLRKGGKRPLFVVAVSARVYVPLVRISSKVSSATFAGPRRLPWTSTG